MQKQINNLLEQQLHFYVLKTENGLRRVRNPWYNKIGRVNFLHMPYTPGFSPAATCPWEGAELTPGPPLIPVTGAEGSGTFWEEGLFPLPFDGIIMGLEDVPELPEAVPALSDALSWFVEPLSSCP